MTEDWIAYSDTALRAAGASCGPPLLGASPTDQSFRSGARALAAPRTHCPPAGGSVSLADRPRNTGVFQHASTSWSRCRQYRGHPPERRTTARSGDVARTPPSGVSNIFTTTNWGVARPSKKYSSIPAELNGQHDRHSSGHSRQTEPKVVHTMVSLDWRRRPYRVNYRCEGITPEPPDSPNARQGSRGTSQFPPEECVYTC